MAPKEISSGWSSLDFRFLSWGQNLDSFERGSGVCWAWWGMGTTPPHPLP